ncbi:hypothetical protein Lal_00014470, partial [Lupinus albus]
MPRGRRRGDLLPPRGAEGRGVGRPVDREGGPQGAAPAGDLKQSSYAKEIVSKTAEAFGRLDIVVNNGAFQQPGKSLEEIEDHIFEDHFKTNVFGSFYVTKAALAHLKPGASVIFTSSVNSKHPMPTLMAYSATKGALSNMVLSLSQLLAEKGIRVNGVLPGPIWTPFIPSGMSEDAVKTFGSQVPFGRPGQPAELASAYVMLASEESSYTSGALVTVAGAMRSSEDRSGPDGLEAACRVAGGPEVEVGRIELGEPPQTLGSRRVKRRLFRLRSRAARTSCNVPVDVHRGLAEGI